MSEQEMHIWWQIHHGEAPIVDMHVHLSLKAYLFKRVLTARFGADRAFNPFSVRTDFRRLEEGGVDVLFSTVYAPERRIVGDCAYLKLLRWLMPVTYYQVFRRNYFDVTWHILDVMEEQVHRSIRRGRRPATVVTSKAALELFYRASSLAESLHSWLRPHLRADKGMPDWLLPLLQLFWNHHTFQRGKRKGQSPLELAGVEQPRSWAEVLDSLVQQQLGTPAAC